MKAKFIALLLAVMMCLSLAACGASEHEDAQDTNLESKEDTQTEAVSVDSSEEDAGQDVDIPTDGLSLYGSVYNQDGFRVSIGDTYQSVVTQIGAPEPMESENSNDYIWVNSSRSGGLIITVDQSWTITTICIYNTDDWKLGCGISLQSTEDDLAAIMGCAPDQDDDGFLYYYFDPDFSPYTGEDFCAVNAFCFEEDPVILIYQSEVLNTETYAPESQFGPSYAVTYQNHTLYTDSLGNLRDYVLVEVKNTGTTNLYLKNASFSFEDENGKLVGVDSGLISADPEIIAPGECGYFYSNMGSVSGDIVADGNYTLAADLIVEEAQNEIVRYEISDTSISAGTFGPFEVIGRVTNNTDSDESLVWIAAVFYDETDTPLGVAGVNVTDLTAGSSQTFSIGTAFLSELDLSVDDVARYEVYACKTQYQF